jgi:chemotaxis protein CheX
MPDDNMPSRPDNAEIPSIYFSNAVKEVLRTMLGLELNEVKVVSDNSENVKEEVTGLLPVSGDFNMMVTLGMSKKTASAIVVYMTGMQSSELRDDEMYDGIAELVNMIAGNIKTQMTGKGIHFKILYPYVIAGSNYTILQKNKVDTLTKRFRAGTVDLILKAHFYHI